MSQSKLLDELIEAFTCLPSVGPKSAQRMAYHILERNRDAGQQLSVLLGRAVKEIGHCKQCRTLSESDICDLCASAKRDSRLLCIVEMPIDVTVLEQSIGYNGLYYVLMGKLSPLDGIGPKELGLDVLDERLAQGEVDELILATNPTVEGEATAYYISEMAKKHGVAVSRIAHGVPLGGELEYIDGGTLSHAFNQRTVVQYDDT